MPIMRLDPLLTIAYGTQCGELHIFAQTIGCGFELRLDERQMECGNLGLSLGEE